MNKLNEILENLICNKFIDARETKDGNLLSINFKNTDKFNFAFDVMDVLGKNCPDNIAMLYIDKNKNERTFSFGEIMRLTNRAANYFKAVGIKKGDKVMLVLKRHYQFWIAILALHKIGAVAVPATSQLREGDFIYRFDVGEISTCICTGEDDAAQKAEAAMRGKTIKRIIVNGSLCGWDDFDLEIMKYSEEFERKEESPSGDDLFMMFFTSGTTGYPKMVSHNYKYPLGHYVTAKYWHNIKPQDLHFTVSDTGWGKAVWGKLYGQWLCGATVFVYDFDRFSASDVLPMFKKYNIKTFCAPPTVYRMLIKENLESYDLSSIRCATTAGEPLNPEVYTRFYEATGMRIMEGFGQTETPLIIGTLRGMEPKAGSMGKPVPSYNIGLMNADGGECEADEVGEIVIYDSIEPMCGLFMGYYNREDLTKEQRYRGAYHTLDLAKRDADGYYYYVGRCDDIIKSSGYKIGPFEIENVIMELPFVLECAISGEPDEIRGQIVKASIVLTAGTKPSEDLKKQIQDYVKEKTAPYKYPRRVVFLDELPKTISGKVIRGKL